MQLFLENVRGAIRSIWSNKVRSFLTMLGVIIGVFAVVVLISLVEGLDKQVRDQFSNLGSEIMFVVAGDIEESSPFNETAAFARLKKTDIDLVKRIENVENATPNYQLPVRAKYLDREKNVILLGITHKFIDYLWGLEVTDGKFFRNDDDFGAVIGKDVAIELYGSPNRAVGKDIRAGGVTYPILGVFGENKQSVARFQINDVVMLPPLTMERNHEVFLAEMLIRLKSPDEISVTKREIERELLDDHGEKDFSVITNEELGDILGTITGFLSVALGGITSISLIVGGIGIMNIMLVNVTERTKEIGIRKALGATNSSILEQFLIEAIVVSLLGGLIGLGFGYLVGFIIEQFFNFPTNITTQTILLSLGFSVGVGVIFGIAPAYNASKRDPVDALRYE